MITAKSVHSSFTEHKQSFVDFFSDAYQMQGPMYKSKAEASTSKAIP